MSRLQSWTWCGLLMMAICCLVSGAVHGADEHPPADHAAAGGHDAHGEAHETGLPMNFKADLALWSLVTFLLFVFVLGKFAWAPLAAALDQREAGIRKDIADAEASRVKAESLLREYQGKLTQAQDEVKAILAEARRDAEHMKQDMLATAQREAEATRQRSITEIERARDAALGEIFDFVAKNVVQATEQVLQRNLTGDDHERLVRDALSQMDVRKN
ncbi:MAG: F0F1 ATP synthase subunit B [Planctomycetaceae bacterium]|nr:F0F1 ATP synthase subunit B [Planctomycetaceae bacterium]